MKVRPTLSHSGWLLLQDVPCDAMIVAQGLTIQGAQDAQLAFSAVADDISTIAEARAVFAQLDAIAGGFERMSAN